jgi:hypothetical protein
MPIGYLANLLIPSITSAGIFILFWIYLREKINFNIISEIGFLYAGFIVLYTLAPALNILLGLDSNDPIALLNATEFDLRDHLWRHVLFLFAFILGYILFRGSNLINVNYSNSRIRKFSHTIIFLLIFLIFCVFYLILVAPKAENYYDAYLRYENLSWLSKKIASACIRFKSGIYAALLTFLFLNYQKLKRFIPLTLIAISLFELLFSNGSRVVMFMIFVQSISLYSICVKPINLKFIMLIGLMTLPLFSLIEILRIEHSDFNSVFASGYIKLPWELNSVFYSGLFLYLERSHDSLPSIAWQMFFNDFISLFTFNDFLEFNIMDWFYRNYFPEATVAPYTIGPIAESSIWGGEVDLFFRGFINGLFFAFIARCFIAHQNSWWGIMIYSFCCSMALITLKYSVFYMLTPLFKSILPTIIILLLFRAIINFNKNKYASNLMKDNNKIF